MGYRQATKFVARIVVGSIAAILLGRWLDGMLHTTPLMILALLLYVIFGSLFLLIRESRHGK